ncbi:ATP-binding cassette domain-containing protein [Candidatus Coxiella mudrowiae]|uniref:ABC transporter maintaining OM lipid asymmetry, ATP-binding protein MlaF n=1 Tax=Candidatus Coxiella mudrowiae TaxID=2054173 RepID=A0ABN4HQK7_9COXI|nr:ATP-binding cassette domain-containing protein [Candidatus Coxiella mudrowiae]AKQ33427.1 ABC transporter maintaining OM lipid asymmetry, ATP-binding protein MlaF [Candidatus Coxiella mudrowiae]AKQ33514.1 ABC transporter maintaining OM lipid asymmetry, ATP-binding protein MlaF [Candidatus Coxiella mudrowiae]
MSVVIARNLSYSRKNNLIFNKINFEIARGKVTAIMGPSGSGKTTLLRLLSGQIKPFEGSLEVNGINSLSLSRSKLNQLRRKMGVLFQQGALFTDLNVFENVAFPLREHTNLPDDMIRDLVLMKLESVGLRGATSLFVNQLSGGMIQRVALARAIMLDPELMLYDEPFSGQDPINRGILLRLIRKLNKALGMTSVLVSHDFMEVTAISDYIYVIAGGKIIGSGSSEVIKTAQDPQIRQFVNGFADGPVHFRYPASDYRQDLLL